MEEAKEMLKRAKEWLEKYKTELKPYIKQATVYSPADVSIIFNYAGEMVLCMLYYDLNIDDLSEEEKNIRNQLEDAEKEIKEILDEKEKEFEEQSDYVLEDDVREDEQDYLS